MAADRLDLFATVTIKVWTKSGVDLTIEEEDEVTDAFVAAEKAVIDRLDASKFEVSSDA